MRVEPEADLGVERREPCVQVAPFDPEPVLLGAEEHVLRHGEVGHEREFLGDHGDPAPLRDPGVPSFDGGAVDEDLALIGGVDAGDHLAECRFARAVLTDERVDLSGAHVERDRVEGMGRPEALLHAAQFDEHGACRPGHPSSRSTRR